MRLWRARPFRRHLAQRHPLRPPPATWPVPLSTRPSFRSHPGCTAPLSERPCGLLMPCICPSACPARSLNPRPLLRRGSSFGSLWGLRWKPLRMLATTPLFSPALGLFGSWFPACCFSAFRASACSANLSGATASPRSAAGLPSLPRPTWLGRRLRPPRLPRLLPRRPAPTGGPSGRLPLSAWASCAPPSWPAHSVRLPPGLLLASRGRRTHQPAVCQGRPGPGASPSTPMVALQKPNGRVRGIVVSDFLRRLVARSFAQHFAATLQEACAPFEFGLSTRAGAFATESDPDATVLFVDEIGAVDTVSRQAMLHALRHVPGANAMLPFVRQFYASRSRFNWHDAQGAPHMIFQAEGGPPKGHV